MHWETTTSYIRRLALRHQLTTAHLLSALGIPRPLIHDECSRPYTPYTATLELYLNAAGRRLIAAFADIPEDHLGLALPEWNEYRDRSHTAPARATLRLAGRPAVTGCPNCTVARTGFGGAIKKYLPDIALICRRHQTWMLRPHTLAGVPFPIEQADLRRTPEILTAHQAHLRLLRRWGAEGNRAFNEAADLTERWRRNPPPDETIWPARARGISHNKRVRLWYTLARDAITYPETIAIAKLMINPRRPHRRLGQGKLLYAAIAAQLKRPWLADPSHYPPDFHQRTYLPPRHAIERGPWWPYRYSTYSTWRDEKETVELTKLGYKPPASGKHKIHPSKTKKQHSIEFR
jgi:hypothetical protein